VTTAAKIYSPEELLAKLDFTDYGNEQAFELLYRDQYRYNATSKQWLKWNGTCWQPDTTGEVDRSMLAVATARLKAVSTLKKIGRPSNPLATC
jgi:hypothetical protein